MKKIFPFIVLLIIIVNVLYPNLVDIHGSEMLFSIICFYFEPVILGVIFGLFFSNKELFLIIGYFGYLGIGHYWVFETLNFNSFVFTFIGLGIGFVLNIKKNIKLTKNNKETIR